MKWYKRDPDAFFAATRTLTLEERGAYNDLLDLLYARDGEIPDNDHFMSRNLCCRPQVWRRLKARLMAAGKVRVIDGKLTANRVETELISARKLMENMAHLGRVSAEKRNKNKATYSTGPSDTTTTTSTTRAVRAVRAEGGKTPQKGFSPLLPEELLPSALEGKENNFPARSLAALPAGALSREPDSEPAEGKRVADKKPAEMTLAEVNARWRLNGGFG